MIPEGVCSKSSLILLRSCCLKILLHVDTAQHVCSLHTSSGWLARHAICTAHYACWRSTGEQEYQQMLS